MPALALMLCLLLLELHTLKLSACCNVSVAPASSPVDSISCVDLSLLGVAAAAAARYVAEGGDWRKSYYMPTRADAAIMAMRKWMDKHAGGGIPWPQHLQVNA
jgi:hypothetical protein